MVAKQGGPGGGTYVVLHVSEGHALLDVIEIKPMETGVVAVGGVKMRPTAPVAAQQPAQAEQSQEKPGDAAQPLRAMTLDVTVEPEQAIGGKSVPRGGWVTVVARDPEGRGVKGAVLLNGAQVGGTEQRIAFRATSQPTAFKDWSGGVIYSPYVPPAGTVKATGFQDATFTIAWKTPQLVAQVQEDKMRASPGYRAIQVTVADENGAPVAATVSVNGVNAPTLGLIRYPACTLSPARAKLRTPGYVPFSGDGFARASYYAEGRFTAPTADATECAGFKP